MQHPEITWAEDTGYPSWMQPPRKRPRAGNVTNRGKGGMLMCPGLESLQQVELMMTLRLKRMAAEEDGVKFDANDFRRNVSSLKDLKEMIRDDRQQQNRSGIRVQLDGETEDFAG